MSFLKAKSDVQRRSKGWHAWIDQHRHELTAIGLPPEVYLDESHWSDFLQNGDMHWHESSGFSFDQLSQGQMAVLHRFLEREYGEHEEWPLLGWLRVLYSSH